MESGSKKRTLIGDEEERTPQELTAETAAATVIAIDQQLYEEEGDWERGAHVGEVHGTAIVTHGGRLVCALTFELEDEGTIAAHGVLPMEGSSFGGGRIAVTGGTGRYDRASGSIKVDSRNPKRYRLAI